MKNRVTAALLSLCIVLALSAVMPDQAYAAEEQRVLCRTLVDTITGTCVCTLSDETGLSRGEAVSALVRLFGLERAEAQGGQYSDVKEDSPYYKAVNLALVYDWIAPGELFEPERNITEDELIKIMVSALGYDYAAGYMGGFPSGYRTVARRLGLYTEMPAAGEITVGAFYDLAYQALETRIADASYQKLTSENAFEVTYAMSDQSMMEALYEVHAVEGIITALNWTAIYGAETAVDADYFELDGKAYRWHGQENSWLGKHCRAFYKEIDGVKQILTVLEKDNRSLEIKAKDVSGLHETGLSYYSEDGRQKSLRLEDGYALIYNGRYAEKLGIDPAKAGAGRLRALDNDGDGVYEILFLDVYDYIYVSSVDLEQKRIADGRQKTVSFDTREIWGLRVTETDGTSLEPWQIKSGDVLAVRRSLDGICCELIRCSARLKGLVTEIRKEEGKVTIGGAAYEMSPYAMERCSGVYPGTEYRGVLGLDGEIAYMAAEKDGGSYGYLTAYSDTGDLSHTVLLKIFTEDGEMEVLNCANRIQVDAREEKLTSAGFADMLKQSFAPSVIKYRTNSAGEVMEIDFPKTEDTFTEDRTLPDSLSEMDFGTTDFTYKTPQLGCPPYFNFTGTVIFGIPADSNRDEDYTLLSTSSFANDEKLTCRVYDVDPYASAGAAVVSMTANELGGKYDNLIVGQISRTINGEGESGTGLECYGGYEIQAFVDLFLPDDVPVKKPNNRPLAPGDIIRVRRDSENRIHALEVDFEVLDGQPVKNSVSTAAASVFGGGNSAFTYQWGMLYAAGNGYMTIAPDQNGSYDLAHAKLRNFVMTSGAAAVCFDMTMGTLIPVSAEELHSYMAYGEEADLTVIRQANYATRTIFIYRP